MTIEASMTAFQPLRKIWERGALGSEHFADSGSEFVHFDRLLNDRPFRSPVPKLLAITGDGGAS